MTARLRPRVDAETRLERAPGQGRPSVFRRLLTVPDTQPDVEEESDGRIGLEHVLRGIAVVHVVVDDRHAAHP